LARPLLIPDEVKKSITAHLSASMVRAVAGYLSANEDEDTLTGDLGASLRIGSQRVRVENVEIGGTWTWSLTYYKFRGRGPKASESFLGADGIFELSVKWNEENEDKKSVLFQAKNSWINSDRDLLEECIKLSTWREAAFVLNYTPDNYEAFSIDEVLRTRGRRSLTRDGTSLSTFLSGDFLDCLIGDMELRYDAKARKLIWRAVSGELVETKFTIPHRFAIKITPPKRYRTQPSRYREIPNADVHNYRMWANEEDVLSLKIDHSEKDLNRARKQLAQIYHPDNYSDLDSLYQEIMTKRMQRINESHDVLHAKIQQDKS
jgi:hypothetical protein